MFVGDDWYASEKWEQYEKEFKENNIRVVYFPYTKGVSSTKIAQLLNSSRGWSTDAALNLLRENDIAKGGSED